MSFHEVRFPAALSFGAMGGPERRTDIVTLANGHEERNSPWAHSRRRYNAGMGLRAHDDLAELVAFFEARQGPLNGFRWKDWGDYKSCAPSASVTCLDQIIGQGDGAQATFQLTKTYGSGAQSYVRPITKPVGGTVHVAVDDVDVQPAVDFTLDLTTGQVVFLQPPAVGAVIKAGFEFDVPVRFDTDLIQTSLATFEAGEAPDVPVLEVRT